VSQLSNDGRKALAEVASHHDVSQDVAEHLLMALIAGQGTQAQFNHPELADLRQVDLEQPGPSGTKTVNDKSAPALPDALLKSAAETGPAAPSLAEAGPAPDALEPVEPEPIQTDAPRTEPEPVSAASDESDIFAKIERLAALHAKGVLTAPRIQLDAQRTL